MPLNFRTLDLNLLRVFDTVMAERSLTRAAGVLAMTQPAVSHAVKRLRDVVGDDLFTRTAAGVKPTPKAEALWPQIREALGTLRHALAPGDFDPHSESASFRLVMADATAALLCPPLMTAVEAEAPGVSMRVLPLTTRDPRRMLESGEIDVAVGYFPEAVTSILAEGSESALRHARLYATRYVCVMRQGHPLADAPLTLDAYCAAHHLLVSFSGRAHGFVDQALAGLGRRRRIALTVNQFFTAGRVVARTDLLTVLPEGFVGEAIGNQGGLVVRELPLTLAPVHVAMLWHLRQDVDPAQCWLRTMLERAARG